METAALQRAVTAALGGIVAVDRRLPQRAADAKGTPGQLQVGKRSQAVFRAELRRALDSLDGLDRARQRGVCDALLWAAGERAHAPVTGTVSTGVPSTDDLRLEDDAAHAGVVVGTPQRAPDYCDGVQHALQWVTEETNDPPTP